MLGHYRVENSSVVGHCPSGLEYDLIFKDVKGSCGGRGGLTNPGVN